MNSRLSLALALSSLLAISGCTVCHDEIQSESISPDGQWSANVTHRTCSASSSQLTGVYLQRATSSPRKLGEIVVIARNQHSFTLRWPDSHTLAVACSGCAGDLRVHRTEAHGISIHTEAR